MTTDSRRLTRFLLIAALLYVAWHLFYTRLIHQGSAGFAYDLALCAHIAEASAGLLRVLGYDTYAAGPHQAFIYIKVNAELLRDLGYGAYVATTNGALPAMKDWHLVSVGWQCDGLSLMALFAGFIIAYPGPWRAKLWFIPAGIVAIHLLNIVRVAALALNQLYSRNTMEFNHHYTFTIVIYGFIFWVWTIWVRRFVNRAPVGGAGGAQPALAGAPAAPASSSPTPTTHD